MTDVYSQKGEGPASALEGTGREGGPSAPGLYLPVALAPLVAVWAAIVVAASLAGAFLPVDGAPPPGIPIAILAPPALFYLAYRTVPSVRAWVAALDLAAVIALQGWRVLGAVFLFLWFYGQLPAAFAWPAGAGDVAVGLAAPFVAAAVIHKAGNWRRRAKVLIIAGMIDFVVAVGTGVVSVSGGLLAMAGQPGSELVNAFPLVLVPALFVPMFIIFHMIAWIKLERERG